MRYTIEELKAMPLTFLRNIDIQTKEDEDLIQSIVNEKLAEMPQEVDINVPSYMTDNLNPEKEAELQREIDAKRAEQMERLVPKDSTDGFVPLENVEPTTIEPMIQPTDSEPSEITVTVTQPEPVVEEPVVEKRFCEYCDSKGVRHKKNCTRPNIINQEN